MCGDCACDEDDAPTAPPVKKNVCCTDIIFLILFVLFWGGMIYVAAFSIAEGDVMRLVYGYDSFGNTCNQQNKIIANVSNSGMDTRGHPYVMFMDVYDPLDSLQLCVKKCPDEELATPWEVKKWAEAENVTLCRYDTPLYDYTDQTLYDRRGPCPELPVLKSKAVLNRCFPDIAYYASSVQGSAEARTAAIRNYSIGMVKTLNTDDVFRRVLSDLYATWREIIVLCAIAVVITCIMIGVLRYLASIVVWFIIAIACLGSLAGTAFLWWTYIDMKNSNDGDENLDLPILSVDISNETAFLAFSIIATVLTVILLLVLLVMRKRIALAVALFKEAGKFVIAVPMSLFQPLWTAFVLLAFFTYWIIIMGYMSTAGFPSSTTKNGFLAVEYVNPATVRYMWWYHVFGLIWTSEFILACQQLVVAATVAKWYFTRDKKNVPCTLICSATCDCILHHLGTVAFGSLIITAVKFPRMVLMYIQSKIEKSQNDCAKFCTKCCICCLWCLEKILKFINQNAYTITAIEGKSFCPAAKKAVTIIINNPLRIAAVNSVGGFILFIGKIGVVAIAGTLAAVWFKAFTIIASNVLRVAAINSVGTFVLILGKMGVMACTASIALVWFKHKEELHYYAIPVLIICVFSYFIAHCFLSVYEMVVDTLLLCFCEDCMLNDGTAGREYYMSPGLMDFVKKSKEALDNMEKKSNKTKEEALNADEATELKQNDPAA